MMNKFNLYVFFVMFACLSVDMTFAVNEDPVQEYIPAPMQYNDPAQGNVIQMAGETVIQRGVMASVLVAAAQAHNNEDLDDLATSEFHGHHHNQS